MKNIDLEALKKATQALGEEQWHQDGTGTIWLAPSDPVLGPSDINSAVLEVYLRTDEKDGDRQQFLALANPAAVLALIARLERAENNKFNFSDYARLIESRYLEALQLIREIKAFIPANEITLCNKAEGFLETLDAAEECAQVTK